MYSKKITAIGEILWDIYPDKKRLGGAPFNFIYHVWKLCGAANFISSVGNDDNGKELLDSLRSAGFETKGIFVDEIHPTGTVNVIIDEYKIPHFTISSSCSFDFLELNDGSKRLLQEETDLLYFGTFTTRNEVSRNTILSILNDPQKKYFSDLNLRHDFYSKEFIETTLRVCNIIKMNLEELEKLITIFSLSNNHDDAVFQVMNRFNIEMIALTLGETGAKIFAKSESNYREAENTAVIDTLGAGDAYSAVFCLGYMRGWDIAKINKVANQFAGEICMVDGALPDNDLFYDKYRNNFIRG